MKIIFLDFDGVLNSQEFLKSHQGGFGMTQVDPRAAARLEKLVKATSAQIVISSSWGSYSGSSRYRPNSGWGEQSWIRNSGMAGT
jgi:histidinol phosphatase-like enzyme